MSVMSAWSVNLSVTLSSRPWESEPDCPAQENRQRGLAILNGLHMMDAFNAGLLKEQGGRTE